MKEENTLDKVLAEKKQQLDPAKPEKLSYDELRMRMGQMQQDLRQATMQLRQADEYISSLQTQNLFSYMSFLFKVMEHPEMYKEEFLDLCVEDIVSLMTNLHEIMNPKHEEEEDNNGKTGAQTE